MNKYRHILFLCFFIFSTIGYAQIANSNLVIRGKYTESATVKLRWVLKDIKTWYKGLHYGYEVRRMSFSDTSGAKYGITEMANSRVLLSGNVKNLDSLVWKHLLNVDSLSNYDKLAAGAMFYKDLSGGNPSGNSKNSNYPLMIKIGLKSLINNDLYWLWTRLHSTIDICKLTYSNCQDTYLGNNLFLNNLYNSISQSDLNIDGPFKFGIKYNSKKATNQGIGSYKYTLNN